MLSPDHHSRIAIVADRQVELRRRAEADHTRRTAGGTVAAAAAARRRLRLPLVRRAAHAS